MSEEPTFITPEPRSAYDESVKAGEAKAERAKQLAEAEALVATAHPVESATEAATVPVVASDSPEATSTAATPMVSRRRP